MSRVLNQVCVSTRADPPVVLGSAASRWPCNCGASQFRIPLDTPLRHLGKVYAGGGERQ